MVQWLGLSLAFNARLHSAAKEKKICIYLKYCRGVLWIFPHLKIFFKLDSSEDSSFRLWNIILLNVEADYNLSPRINMKTVLILFTFSFLLVI